MFDLKDAFFCTPLHIHSLFPSASQPIRTVLPQSFRDSPHLLGQVLFHALKCFKYSQVTALQYVGDIQLCAPSEELCGKTIHALLNFLEDRLSAL